MGPFLDCERDHTIVKSLAEALPKKTAALAIISPYFPTQVTPSRIVQATIGLEEELATEEMVELTNSEEIDSLYLILNTYGGRADSSFKVARRLRSHFEHIKVYIPHFALSGGTLLALAGNQIVLGEMSHIGPIDLQVFRNGNYYSVNAMIRAFAALNEYFKDVHVEDAPYPMKAMADKLDPVEFQQWSDASEEMEAYASQILKHVKSPFRNRADEIIYELSVNTPTHTTAILRDRAKEILGDPVLFSEADGPYFWETARLWLRAYSTAKSPYHFIRYFIPGLDYKNSDTFKGEERQ
jgi:hypothetical protein